MGEQSLLGFPRQPCGPRGSTGSGSQGEGGPEPPWVPGEERAGGGAQGWPLGSFWRAPGAGRVWEPTEGGGVGSGMGGSGFLFLGLSRLCGSGPCEVSRAPTSGHQNRERKRQVNTRQPQGPQRLCGGRGPSWSLGGGDGSPGAFPRGPEERACAGEAARRPVWHPGSSVRHAFIRWWLIQRCVRPSAGFAFTAVTHGPALRKPVVL